MTTSTERSKPHPYLAETNIAANFGQQPVEYERNDFLVPGCQEACPAGTDVPAYAAAIWEQDFKTAFDVIIENNPFASVCGRVCAMPCESACRRGESDGAVPIRGLKRFVMDQTAGEAGRPQVAVTRTETVGIVGSGPAGLTAAQDLAEAGYEVHIYERRAVLGGMMRAGIPPFRLPSELLERDITRIIEHCPGIVPHLGCEIGTHVSPEELKARHDAVLLTVGLWRDRELGVPGEVKDLEGLHGIDFLVRVSEGRPLRVDGKKVVVVGGGNVAVDVARTALRLGATSVELSCLEARDEMPAWEHELGEAVAEGVVINNGWGPHEIHHERGQVTGIDFVRCLSVFDEEGRFSPTFEPTTARACQADVILLAIGLGTDATGLEDVGRADPETTRTLDPKVFASGDGAFGPSSVIESVARGHRAAHYIRAFLEGVDVPARYRPAYRSRLLPVAQDPNWEKFPREQPLFHGFTTACSIDTPCEEGFDLETARRQAARCLRCDKETGTAELSRRTREHIHAMARTSPDDTERLRSLLQARLWPRDNPFPSGRPASLDDVVFLAAALTRLVIDPYREDCDSRTTLGGRLHMAHPYLVTGFDDAPQETRQALLDALREKSCGYVGARRLGEGVPWLQLVCDGEEPEPDADGVIHVLGSRFRPVDLRRGSPTQMLGLAVSAHALPEAIPHALEHDFDLLLLDGSPGLAVPWSELKGTPDLTVLRDAIRILRELDQEEKIDLVYFGGLRTGTDVGKVLAINCRAAVVGVPMALALGAKISDGRLVFDETRPFSELRAAALNWLKSSAEETAIIARCVGKTNIHNLEPEDMRAISLATAEALGIPLASGGVGAGPVRQRT